MLELREVSVRSNIELVRKHAVHENGQNPLRNTKHRCVKPGK